MSPPENSVHLKIVLFAAIVSSVLAADSTDLSRLRTDLLLGYDKNARPVPANKNTVQVTINPWLRGFEMDETRSIFTLYCWTVMTWYDTHLKWEPRNYGNISKIPFAAHEVWQPDLSVYNNLDQSEIDHFGNTRVIAMSNGKMIWVPPTKFQVGCSTDLRQWPYDTAICFVIIGSWAHDGNMLDLAVPPNMTELGGNEIIQNREWSLERTEIARREVTYGDIPYPDVTVTVHLKRRPATHTAAVVVPGFAITSAILISFWLRPGASERLALILLVILINALYLNRLYSQLGTHGRLVLFYRDSLVMVSVSLIWTILLRYLAATKRTSPVPLPGFIGSFLESVPAKILCLDPRPVLGSGAASNGGTDDEGKLVSTGNPNQADWAWLAHLLDRVAFVIYLVVYVCFYVALL